MKPITISKWDSAKSVKPEHRTDIKIENFNDLVEVFRVIKPVSEKVDQPIITRCWQESRARTNEKSENRWLITLDYDSVDTEPCEVYQSLRDEDINHFLFTTWTHKTIKTPQKENNGKNCFKVMLEVTADSPAELLVLTRSLGEKVGKTDIKTVDDLSSGIFIGGAHPDFINETEFYYYDKGMGVEETKKYLLTTAPKDEPLKKDPIDDFELWDKTVGQKYTPERIKRALSIIKYEEVENFSKMAVWYSLGYALHSTGDEENFELWDEWCLDNCAEHGVYNREENENFWAKQTAPEKYKDLCTLATLWHLENIFKAKEASSEIRKSSWTFFDRLADEEPEEIQFIIKDLLVEKSIGFLVGTGGVGKSSLCLEVAKAISSGGCFFGDTRFPCIKGTVAIINKEDSLVKVHNQVHNLVELDIERATRKLSDFDEEVILSKENIVEIKHQWDNVARPQWSQSNIRLTDGDGENLEALGAVLGSLKSLQQELNETKRPPLRLVIMDPLNLYHGGDSNSQKDMSYMFSALQQIQQELDVCVLIVHHKNKSNGFSGSHTIRDSGRFMWYLQNKMIGKEVSDKFIELWVDKNNDAKANYTALNFTRTDKGLLDIAEITTEGVEDGE
jgi:hypothetical protein